MALGAGVRGGGIAGEELHMEDGARETPRWPNSQEQSQEGLQALEQAGEAVDAG